MSVWVRNARLELGLTQVAFAWALGVSPATISRAERGVHALHEGTIAKIRELLSVALNEREKGRRQ